MQINPTRFDCTVTGLVFCHTLLKNISNVPSRESKTYPPNVRVAPLVIASLTSRSTAYSVAQNVLKKIPKTPRDGGFIIK